MPADMEEDNKFTDMEEHIKLAGIDPTENSDGELADLEEDNELVDDNLVDEKP